MLKYLLLSIICISLNSFLIINTKTTSQSVGENNDDFERLDFFSEFRNGKIDFQQWENRLAEIKERGKSEGYFWEWIGSKYFHYGPSLIQKGAIGGHEQIMFGTKAETGVTYDDGNWYFWVKPADSTLVKDSDKRLLKHESFSFEIKNNNAESKDNHPIRFSVVYQSGCLTVVDMLNEVCYWFYPEAHSVKRTER